MSLIKYFLLFTSIFAGIHTSKAQTNTDSLFAQLDNALQKRDFYVAQKQRQIGTLRHQLQSLKLLTARHHSYELLYEAYKTFSYDSSYYYAKRLQESAIQLNSASLIADAKMKMGFTLLSSGMFKETFEVLAQIDQRMLSPKDKIGYYFLKARTYFDLADYNRNPDYTAIYNPEGNACIDSALVFCKLGSIDDLELKGLKDLRNGNYNDGEKVYTELLKIRNLSPHQFAVNACCLSYIYEVKGAEEKSVNLLIRAAISDLESATKETIASYKLADVLFKKGDIKNAYTYIKQAMEEATFYGALHRQVKISSILPIIEAQWIAKIENQKRQLYSYSAIITLLVIFVVVFAVIIFRQLKKIKLADETIKAANSNLRETNLALEEVNKKLGIANTLKNEYISYYFNINSVYIDKLENFKKSIDKKLASKRYEDALKTVNDLNLENERLALFNTFDDVFLRLFPNFIEKFNTYFKPEDQFVMSRGQLLNTELRIFALIRMGIQDNDRIAKILGYSVNTIYAYKNRVKTKSILLNEDFEDKILTIEAI